MKVVEIPIYFGNFIMIFSNDRARVEKTVNAEPGEIDYLYAFTFHNFSYKGKESFAVVLNFWGPDEVTIGTIIHEVSHAGNRILAGRGFEKEWYNDESESYLKGWLGDEIEKFMKACDLLTRK
jgi:hypothetical protein